MVMFDRYKRKLLENLSSPLEYGAFVSCDRLNISLLSTSCEKKGKISHLKDRERPT